ncbi:MAG: Ldh family oxidoreductase [Actinobacteria bacterium]|nr:Ldh family oxidoreductase [Actinomycetota bacterium]
MPAFAAEALTQATARLLSAIGTPGDIARRLAESLVNSNCAGHPSHGVIRIPEYTDVVLAGTWDPAARPTVRAETATSVLLDSNNGFGHLSADLVTRLVAAKARASGVAVGGVVRCNHIGRLGEWAELGVGMGVFVIICAGWPLGETGAPYGGREGRLNTNPIAIGAPATDGDYLLVDFATTASAEGKIRVYRDQGLQLPPGWIIDKDGNPSTNPKDLYEGGLHLPFGAHKGSALSLAVAMLGGNLVGAAGPRPNEQIGAFAIAIDAGLFAPRETVLAGVRQELERIRTTAPAPGFAEVLAPGDSERRARARADRDGVDVLDDTWRKMLSTAEQAGVDPAEIEALARGV